MALAHGLRACWSTPISSTTGKVLGTFAIYYDEPRTPTPYEQSLIEQFTHIASIAVERAQNDAALRRSEAFLAEAQLLSSTGSFSWRVATGEITWSAQVYRIFEFDQGVPVTLELIRSRVHPEDIPLFNEMVERARGDSSDFEYEQRLQMPDQSVKYLHVVAHGTRDRVGRLEYVGAIQDVTEHRLSEEALGKVRSELARVARVTSLGALTASIAHEVNQPLSGIITNASTCLRMLAADPPNVGGARETARRTIRDGNRASDVITRLRALFAKKDATTESVDLNEATREVIALSLGELQRSRVIVRAELADDLPPITGDRVQLQQVILNLLRNASDAMCGVNDRPRKLVIKTEREEGDRVRLTVQDAGAGFEPQAVGRLFEAFYTTKSGGMGIGLSVSRSIIESHHGHLWAAPNDGPGATFSFSIPRRPERVAGAHRLGAVRTPAVAAARHVMGKQ
jgi:signal transduction histidine kinase